MSGMKNAQIIKIVSAETTQLSVRSDVRLRKTNLWLEGEGLRNRTSSFSICVLWFQAAEAVGGVPSSQCRFHFDLRPLGEQPADGGRHPPRRLLLCD